MKRSFKDLKAEDLELLIARDTTTRTKSSISTAVKLHMVLFVFGVLGSVACLWAMFFTSYSEEVANTLGMQRVANSLENVLELLEYPFLMFTIILSVYSGQQLFKAYVQANDPETYRRS